MSTLSRGDQIERDFYRLKVQELGPKATEEQIVQTISAAMADLHVEKKRPPDVFQDVAAFQAKFGIVRLLKPGFLPDSQMHFRTKFLEEELDEFIEAWGALDLAKAADALVDLVYVAVGTAVMMGVPFDDCWRAVQEANMKKERATSDRDPRSKRAHDQDIVKPEGWQPPDIQGIIDAAR